MPANFSRDVNSIFEAISGCDTWRVGFWGGLQRMECVIEWVLRFGDKELDDSFNVSSRPFSCFGIVDDDNVGFRRGESP